MPLLFLLVKVIMALEFCVVVEGLVGLPNTDFHAGLFLLLHSFRFIWQFMAWKCFSKVRPEIWAFFSLFLFFVRLYANSFLLQDMSKKNLTFWISLVFLFNGSITAKMESRFSITHSIHKELNLQETILVPDVGKPPKSKRRKQRKNHCLEPHLLLQYVLWIRIQNSHLGLCFLFLFFFSFFPLPHYAASSTLFVKWRFIDKHLLD